VESPEPKKKFRQPHLIATVVVATIALACLTALAFTRTGDQALGMPDTVPPQQQPLAPFAATSIWNAKLTPDAPLDPKSTAYVANFKRQFTQNFGNVGINTSKFTPPVYLVDASVPTTRVGWNDCQKKGSPDVGFLGQVDAVPIPSDAKSSNGSDAEMVVWQPSSDTMWDLWKATKASDGTWSACWGGKLTNVSQSSGVYPAPYGTTASGLALLGGLIRPEELQAGEINHALAVSLVEVKANAFVSPAVRTDGKINSDDAIPEGERFRLDPSVDVESLKMSKAGKIIARAIQQYGLIVRDTAGAVTLYAENTQTADVKLGLVGMSPC